MKKKYFYEWTQDNIWMCNVGRGKSFGIALRSVVVCFIIIPMLYLRHPKEAERILEVCKSVSLRKIIFQI